MRDDRRSGHFRASQKFKDNPKPAPAQTVDCAVVGYRPMDFTRPYLHRFSAWVLGMDTALCVNGKACHQNSIRSGD